MSIWLKRFDPLSSLRRSASLLFVLLCACEPVFRQVTEVRSVDILALIQSGAVQPTSMPAATRDSFHPFDCNPNIEIRTMAVLICGARALDVPLFAHETEERGRR
jgi:hypothetical protein